MLPLITYFFKVKYIYFVNKLLQKWKKSFLWANKNATLSCEVTDRVCELCLYLVAGLCASSLHSGQTVIISWDRVVVLDALFGTALFVNFHQWQRWRVVLNKPHLRWNCHHPRNWRNKREEQEIGGERNKLRGKNRNEGKQNKKKWEEKSRVGTTTSVIKKL